MRAPVHYGRSRGDRRSAAASLGQCDHRERTIDIAFPQFGAPSTSGTVGSASSVAVAAAHDEATLAQRGIDVQPASAIHDEVGLAARGVAAPGTHDEASLASRGIAVQSASAIHDEAGLAARGVAAPGTHDEASLASRGIEVQPLPAVHDEAGLASGLVNTTRQIGGSVGLAALATVAADHTRSLLVTNHASLVPYDPNLFVVFDVFVDDKGQPLP